MIRGLAVTSCRDTFKGAMCNILTHINMDSVVGFFTKLDSSITSLNICFVVENTFFSLNLNKIYIF